MDELQVLFKERFSGVSGDGQTIALCAAPTTLFIDVRLLNLHVGPPLFCAQLIACVETFYYQSSNI